MEEKIVKVVKRKEREKMEGRDDIIEKEKWIMLSHEEEREGMYKMPDTV